MDDACTNRGFWPAVLRKWPRSSMRTLWRLSAILGCCILAFGCSEKDRGYWREGARGQLLTNPTAPFILLILEATEEEQPPPPVPVTPRNSREQKLKRKAQVLVQEARLGSPKAQYELGQTLLDYASYRPVRAGDAAVWFCRAANGGHAEANRSLGWMYDIGLWKYLGRPPDKTRAYLHYTLAVREGSEVALEDRRKLALTMGEEQIAQAQRLAEKWQPGNCEAQLGVSATQSTFIDVEAKPGERAQHVAVLKKATCGDKAAQWSVAYDLEHGYRTDRDLKEAYFWYSLAEQQGHAAAAGFRSRLSERLTADDRAAVDLRIKDWRPQPCDDEPATAAANREPGPPVSSGDGESLWLAYVNRGLPRPQRLSSLCRAADKGHQSARLELARNFWFGNEPFPRDRVKAQMWHILAARSGGQFAKNQMHLHRDKLSKVEAQKSKLLADQWKPGDCEVELEQLRVSAATPNSRGDTATRGRPQDSAFAGPVLMLMPTREFLERTTPESYEGAESMRHSKLPTALANKLARIAWSVLMYQKRFDAHRIEVAAI